MEQSATVVVQEPGLSRRGLKCAEGHPSMQYLGPALQAMQNPWSEQLNPEGYINLAVAENKHDWPILEKDVRTAFEEPIPETVAAYDDMHGNAAFRQTLLSSFLLKYVFLCKGARIDHKRTFSAENLSLTAGCGSAVETLMFCLCERGEGVIVLTPMYPGFIMDITYKIGCTLVPAYQRPEDGFKFNEAVLDEALKRATNEGIRCKVLLLTSPNNPLGTSYSYEEMAAITRWSYRNGLHLVSDEIYAASIFAKPNSAEGKEDKEEADEDEGIPFNDPSFATAAVSQVKGYNRALSFAQRGRDFTSAASFYDHSFSLHEEEKETATKSASMNDRIHIIYGFSKDFGMSGFRCGAIYTENKQLHASLGGLLYFCLCSNLVQHSLRHLLLQEERLAAFLLKNQILLSGLHRTVREAATQEGIPVLPSNAGFFVWLDLRRWLKYLPSASSSSSNGSEEQQQQQKEMLLWTMMTGEAKVIMTPGLSCFCKEAGFFRCCFAAVSDVGLALAFHRMGRVLRRLEAAAAASSS
ncbi:hypothetical protein QOT17_006435 [Balamuthia mandrillaris]